MASTRSASCSATLKIPRHKEAELQLYVWSFTEHGNLVQRQVCNSSKRSARVHPTVEDKGNANEVHNWLDGALLHQLNVRHITALAETLARTAKTLRSTEQAESEGTGAGQDVRPGRQRLDVSSLLETDGAGRYDARAIAHGFTFPATTRQVCCRAGSCDLQWLKRSLATRIEVWAHGPPHLFKRIMNFCLMPAKARLHVLGGPRC